MARPHQLSGIDFKYVIFHFGAWASACGGVLSMTTVRSVLLEVMHFLIDRLPAIHPSIHPGRQINHLDPCWLDGCCRCGFCCGGNYMSHCGPSKNCRSKVKSLLITIISELFKQNSREFMRNLHAGTTSCMFVAIIAELPMNFGGI